MDQAGFETVVAQLVVDDDDLAALVGAHGVLAVATVCTVLLSAVGIGD